jgi:hypothetical protein
MSFAALPADEAACNFTMACVLTAALRFAAQGGFDHALVNASLMVFATVNFPSITDLSRAVYP